eukprot:TRINITY_DN14113_c1_g2_i4.p1 TRINITY_DN14113_c1_g2~~TRINITY_DN14113_c1_g2_i4.p1  ORF type:complete len:383 (+),score=60.18 TRINITY_DN14113_c1_g2_i4:113-1261(+)
MGLLGAALMLLSVHNGRTQDLETDPACWVDDGPFLEMCCSVSPEHSIERGCFDWQFTFERCCSGKVWNPPGYEDWLKMAWHESANHHQHCSEYVKRFDFSEDSDPTKWGRVRECVRHRLTSAQSSFRRSVIAGQHYPTLLSPGPKGQMFLTPANDFVVSKHLKLYGTFDPQELRMYKELIQPGSTVIDIGANVGSYAIPLAIYLGLDGLVVAAEPFQTVFQILTANSAINGLRNLRTRQVGLGANEERVRARGPKLEEWNNAGMARVFRPFEDKHAETFHYKANSEEETISVTTLDKLVEQEELQKVDLVKVDVEGHLKAVLEGGQETLRRLRPIIVAEHSGDDSFELLQRNHRYTCTERLKEHDVWVCIPSEQSENAKVEM